MSWRDQIAIHPSAEVFPLMGEAELRKLADDINANGLKVPIQTCTVDGLTYIEDGRNRLDAMESLEWQIVDDKGEWIGALAGKVEHRTGRTHEQVANDVIAFNIRRRHLTKEQQVELIDGALKVATTTDLANMARSVKRDAGGRLQGSTKDQHKAAVVKHAAQAGISKRTVRRALAKPKKPKPPVDILKEDFVWDRFCRWMDYWPVDHHRKIIAYIHKQTEP